MTIFVPPAVLQEEDAVLNLPVVPHGSKQLIGTNGVRIAAGQEISRVRKTDRTIFCNDVAIDAKCDLAAGEAERVADVFRVV